MAPEYKLVITSRIGAKLGEIVGTAAGGHRSGFLTLSYLRQVNAPGLIRFGLDADSDALDLLEQDGQIEAWRRDVALGIPWGLEITGLYRARRFEPDQDDESASDIGDSDETCTVTCPGVLHFLSRRVNAYRAATLDRSMFRNKHVETIMRALVLYNGTDAATTANGRIRTAAPLPIAVEADQERGPVIDRGNSGANLLKELQELAKIGQLDFDLVRTGDASWTFRVYDLLGTDRSAEAVLSRENGTLNVLTYEQNTIEEKTVAIVAGQGEEAARDITVQTGTTYTSEQDIEAWVDARNVIGGASALAAEGLRALQAARAATDRFDYQVLQAPGDLYGRHYTLGDLRTIGYRDVHSVQQVTTVAVDLDADGEETIDISLAAR